MLFFKDVKEAKKAASKWVKTQLKEIQKNEVKQT